MTVCTFRTSKVSIPRGDYGYNLVFHCKDNLGQIVDLTGYTVHFRVWQYGEPTNMVLDGVGGILDALAGEAYYLLQSGDFDIVGSYQGEVECRKLGEVGSYQSLIVEVTDSP